MAKQGFAYGLFEMDIQEGLSVVEEFYQREEQRWSEVQNDAFNIQQGLKGSVSVLN